MNQVKTLSTSINTCVSSNTVSSIVSKMVSTLMLFSITSMLLFSNTVSAKTPLVDSAEKRVIEVTTNIVNLLEKNKVQYSSDRNALNAMVRREVLPFIDFNAMSKLTLGKQWRKASPAQRNRFINAFREMLVRSYASAMIAYSGSTIRGNNSVASKKPGYALVRTRVIPKSGSSIVGNYSVRKVNNDWKAYNVEIDGINLIANFRTNFTREVSAKGLDSLITRLEKSGR